MGRPLDWLGAEAGSLPLDFWTFGQLGDKIAYEENPKKVSKTDPKRPFVQLARPAIRGGEKVEA